MILIVYKLVDSQQFPDIYRQPINIEPSYEHRLIHYLFKKYEIAHKYARPRKNSSDAVVVDFSLNLKKLLDLNAKNQALTSLIEMTLIWTDDYLSWDRELFNQLQRIQFNVRDIWRPSIRIFQLIEERYEANPVIEAVVEWNGRITWVPRGIYTTPCEVDVTFFPFDRQTCSLEYGNWIHSNDQVQIQLGSYLNNTNKFAYSIDEGAEWEITNVQQEVLNNISYNLACCSNEKFTIMRFHLKLKRNATFLSIVLFLPCSLLMIVNLLTAFLPPSSSEKIHLTLSIFLSYFVLLLIVMDYIPQGSKLPVVGRLFIASLSIIALNIITSAIVYNIALKGVSQIHANQSLKNNLSKLGRFLCIPNAYYMVYMEEENHLDTRVNLVNDHAITELVDENSLKRDKKPIVNCVTSAESENLYPNPEHKLIRNLLSNYERGHRSARPVKNIHKALHLNFTLFLRKLIDLDPKNQELTTLIEIKYEWIDELLKWNESAYHGIKLVEMNIKDIWSPNVRISELTGRKTDFNPIEEVIVESSGRVTFNPREILKTPCDVDVTYFPFERQTCSLSYVNWMHHNKAVFLRLKTSGNLPYDKFYFTPEPGNEWEIIDVHQDIFYHEHYDFECCSNRNFTAMIFKIELKRNATFLAIVLFLPCFLLVLLNLLSTFIPPDSSEKINLALSIFLSYFVLLMIVMDHIPMGRKVPAVGELIVASSVIIACNIITSTAVYNIALKGDGDAKVPDRIKKIILKLRKKLFVPVNYYVHIHSDSNDNDIPLEMMNEVEMENKRMLKKQRKRKANWSDDVLVSSFPKSGTTWVVEIVDEILRRGIEPDNESPTYLRAKMLELGPPAISKSVIDENNDENLMKGEKRVFKTHLAYTSLPSDIRSGQSNIRLIYIVRNVKDNLVSFYHFCRMNELYGLFKGSFSDFYDLWLNGQTPHGDWFEHVKGYLENSVNNENILIISYEELLESTFEMIGKISTFLNINLEDKVVKSIVEKTNIENMRQNKRTNRLEVKAYRQDISQFFRKGIAGDWKNWLNEEQSQRIDRLFEEKLPTDIRILLNKLFLSYN
ncbi:DgyrCDS4046 [Dimorphilus gyrociliatus]|uniref:DgyrCDS4046 n=1 Tax=Dimorphilus gyrociliatus TaxID=2664684 RepID=A0A7I8VGA0_9ANNE|nr:DgyrCDS4046 [Dimorphilus gyrociliatus]